MSLDKRSRLITYFIACGVGIGLPAAIGILDAVLFNNPYYLLFPVPFVGIMYLVWLYAPIGIGIRGSEVQIIRRIGPVKLNLAHIERAKAISNLKDEAGWVMRTGGSGGAWGYYGFFWSKKWGTFKIHATDFSNLVLIETKNRKFLVSPDQKEQFLGAIKNMNNQITIS